MAGFPSVKTLDDFDFDFSTCVAKSQVQQMVSLLFIESAENIVLLGVVSLKPESQARKAIINRVSATLFTVFYLGGW